MDGTAVEEGEEPFALCGAGSLEDAVTAFELEAEAAELRSADDAPVDFDVPDAEVKEDDEDLVLLWLWEPDELDCFDAGGGSGTHFAGAGFEPWLGPCSWEPSVLV